MKNKPKKYVNEHKNLPLVLVCLCQHTVQPHSEEDKVGFTMTPGGNWVQRPLNLEEEFEILNLLPNRLERLTLFSKCTQLY